MINHKIIKVDHVLLCFSFFQFDSYNNCWRRLELLGTILNNMIPRINSSSSVFKTFFGNFFVERARKFPSNCAFFFFFLGGVGGGGKRMT